MNEVALGSEMARIWIACMALVMLFPPEALELMTAQCRDCAEPEPSSSAVFVSILVPMRK
ncbi:MAG: hypothetical protein SA339_02665 [Methanomassiliicoccus sp.]|nr:hypothetical protein [Methanomassiliicoccus sp.]